MYEFIVFTHGCLADAIKESVRLIVSDTTHISSFSVLEGSNLEELKELIKDKIIEFQKKDRKVMVLTDLFYGTPFNITIDLMNSLSIKHIVGINLPLVLELYVKNKEIEGLNDETIRSIVNEAQSAMKIIEWEEI